MLLKVEERSIPKSLLVQPHGGGLVNRVLANGEGAEQRRHATDAPKINLSERNVCDLICIAIGAFSPLTGFMKEDDYRSVTENMRLRNGLLWPIPIVLPVSSSQATELKQQDFAGLVDTDGELVGCIEIAEVYEADHQREIIAVYGTEDTKHAGVAAVVNAPKWYVAGEISVFKMPRLEFPSYSLTPQQTRQRFNDLGWKSVVGFQTRNPVHRAHEYLQKVALEIVDGLLLHPLVGTTKDDDLPAAVRMRCYEALLERYYPRNRTVLSVYQSAMRYAGPREAILHAIARKNYGCSHFIVGRDHAGMGSFYGPFDAQRIFDDIEEELGLTILRFDNAFWCSSCEGMATIKTCPHDEKAHLVLSGTKVRELLRAGHRPPQEYSRPEVADILINALASGQPAKS